MSDIIFMMAFYAPLVVFKHFVDFLDGFLRALLFRNGYAAKRKIHDEVFVRKGGFGNAFGHVVQLPEDLVGNTLRHEIRALDVGVARRDDNLHRIS